jgi:hypothetical protein
MKSFLRVVLLLTAVFTSNFAVQQITLNPKDHPSGTRFLAKCGNMNDKDCVAEYKVREWAKSGYVSTLCSSCSTSRWQSPESIWVIEILPK